MIGVLAFAMGISAQTGKLMKDPASSRVKGKTAALAPRHETETASNQAWWGYVKDNSYRFGLGTGSVGTMNQCILLSKSNSAVVGKTLKAVRFYLRSTTDIKDLKVWLSSTLPTTADKANILVQDVDLSTMQGGDEGDYYNGLPNVVELSTPYTMTSSRNVYVGYSFTVTSVNAQSGQYPIVLCDEEGVTGSSYLKYGSQWEAGQSYGPLDLKVLLEGEFSQNAVSPSSPGEVFAAMGGEVQVSVPFTNVGSAAITSIDFTVSDAQGTGAEQHYDLPEAFPYYGASATFQIPVQAGSEVGSVEKTLTITKVNGQANEAAANSTTFTLTTLSKLVPRGIVIEEFTGTGCGWCPRGLVGMEKMRKEFGDTFVGIGIHNYNNTDPMYISAYNQVSFSGAPSCRLNRGPEIDPYYGSGNDVFDDFRAAMAIPAKAGVTVSGEWNADSTKIVAKAEIEALVDGEYAIEYVLIADSLTGSTNAWKQSNYYYQYTPAQLPADLAFLPGLGSSYFAVFNDVAIAVAKQTQTTAPGKLTAGQVVENTFTLSMPTKSTLLQAITKERVAVVVLLIDKASKTIANAAKFYMPVTAPEPQPVIADGTYYLQNVATGKFLAAGHSWGTRSIVNQDGLDFTFTLAPEGTYTIDSQVSNGGESHFLGSNLFVDQPAFGWAAEKVADGIVTLSDGSKFLAVGDNDETALVEAVTEAAQWRVLTYADRLKTLEGATAADPVDVTFAIKDANFNRNDLRKSAWQIWSENADGKTNFNISGGNNENNAAESYHAKFSLEQVIEGLPNGSYALTAQGFYRQDGEDAENLPYFFVNDKTAAFPVIGELPDHDVNGGNSMGDASVEFANGLYTINPIKFYVADGKITLGAKNDANLNLWVIWDNFRLCYLGTEPLPEVLEQTINVKRETGMGYNVTVGEVDFTEAKAYLGVDQLATSMLSFVNPDGSEIDYAAYQTANYDGWCNEEGAAENWGSNTKICVKFFQAIPEGQFEICDMNGADVPGKTYSVKWALKNDKKSVVYTINVTFNKPEVQEMEIVDKGIATSVTYDIAEGDYTPKETTITDDQVAAICQELGIGALTEATIFGYNPTTKELVKNHAGYDGWRDANGDFHNWNADGTQAPACVKIIEGDKGDGGKTYFCYNRGGQKPQTIKCYWALANEVKAVLVEIDFIYEGAAPDDPELVAPEGWTSVIVNGNLAGDNVQNYFSKEYPAPNPGPSTIVAGAGKNGSRGIVVKTQDKVSEAWDSQFFIRFNDKLAEGTQLHVEFDYKADNGGSVSTQSHGEPGAYQHWAAIGNVNFTPEWQHYTADVTVEGAMADMQSIAFNLNDVATADNYYFDNFGIWVKAPEIPDEWADLLINGNMEGTEVANFFSKEAPSAEVLPSRIFDGMGKDGSRGIKVESAAGASQDWDSQFWIYLPTTLPAGTKYKVEFDYRADRDASADTQAHAAPGNYIFYSMIGSPAFTTEWQHYEKIGSITADQASNADGLQFQSIAFNLSKDRENDVKFFFDNIKFQVEKSWYDTGIRTISNESEGKNIFNLRGQQVQNPSKGLYIINGKKVVVK